MIGILFTGGTIAMKLDPAVGAAVPALSSADILAQVPGLDAIARIEVEDFSRLPGPHVTPQQMWRLATRSAEWLQRADVEGLVITHGTDTIEETAYLLELVLRTEKPVVLVGAMKTMSDAGWDGPANLLSAVRVAASGDACGQGVLVVMDDHILPAREVRKVHTESSGSFATPEFGPLGQVDAGVVRFRRRTLPRADWQREDAPAGLRIGHIETRVALVQAYTGMEESVVTPFVESDMRGLAVVGFGRGNVPPTIVPALETAVRKGIVVTISSRSAAGRVSARYGYAGGGHHLQQIGAILAGDLSGAKARLLQMVALAAEPDTRAAREFIQTLL